MQEPTVDPLPEEEVVIGYENPGDPLRIFLPAIFAIGSCPAALVLF